MRLSDFQDGLASALLPPPGASVPPPAWLDALLAQPGFAVYRNTVAKGCIDALQANYPAVHALVGTDWLRAAAHAFVHQHPPTDGCLMDYGAGFADFLEGFGPAADLPYLAAVARLDRCWTESHLAADAPALQAAWLARQPPEALALLHLQPHPAARWQWCAARVRCCTQEPCRRLPPTAACRTAVPVCSSLHTPCNLARLPYRTSESGRPPSRSWGQPTLPSG